MAAILFSGLFQLAASHDYGLTMYLAVRVALPRRHAEIASIRCYIADSRFRPYGPGAEAIDAVAEPGNPHKRGPPHHMPAPRRRPYRPVRQDRPASADRSFYAARKVDRSSFPCRPKWSATEQELANRPQ